ncbi:MAG: SRPBCC domain-containing protein [Myxococcota bacterium]
MLTKQTDRSRRRTGWAALAVASFLVACAQTPPPTSAPVSADVPDPADALSLHFVEYVRAPPSAVWSALTTPEQTRQFFHRTAVQVDLREGGVLEHRTADGSRVVIAGRVRRADAPHTLAYDFRFPEYEDTATQVTYTTEDVGDGTTRLTIDHEGFPGRTKTYRRVIDGWPPVLSGLKTLLESGDPLPIPSFATGVGKAPAPDHPQQRYVAYIATTPTALWGALTEPSLTEKYFHGMRIAGELAAGGPIAYTRGTPAAPAIEGTLLHVEPGRGLSFTFQRAGVDDERPSQVRYEIDDLGEGVCRLIVLHDFETESETYRRVAHGWPPIVSGLKTLLESGTSLPIALR